MKIKLKLIQSARSTLGMTLVEMMCSLVIFMLLIAGLISVNLFGMRQDELVNSALGANDQSRLNFNLMLDEIRSSKNIQIGHGDYTSFVALTNGLAQQGETLVSATNEV